MILNFPLIICSFTVYSIAGWLIESLLCTLLARRSVNRGVLAGPFCPFYGFAALVALAIGTLPTRQYPPVTFALCIVGLTAFQYITSLVLEKLFSLRLWHYKSRPLNLHGRVYFLPSLLLGLFGSAVIYLAQPQLENLAALINPATLRTVSSLLIGLFALEAYRFLSTLSQLTRLLDEIAKAGNQIPEKALKPHGTYARCFRLLNAYPRLEVMGHTEALAALHEEWDTSRSAFGKRLREITSALGHKTVDGIKQLNPFAQGLSFHKLVWIFAIGCVLGYLIETAFCLVNRGVLESRQGMVYGPFNQVYGLGAVLMSILLMPFSKKGNGWLFFGGAIVGGAFEFVASWLQERVLGTVSWEYSGQAFSIGGRTSLLFMFYWGVLGVVYMRQVYPRLSGLIERIPKRQGTFISWALVVTLGANMAISFVAVDRWIDRQHGQVASTSFQTFLDTRYPDEMMEEIYPSMMLIDEDGTRPTRTNI